MSIYKSLFSHRKGLTPQTAVMHKDCIPSEVVNAINSSYYLLCEELKIQGHYFGYTQQEIEKLIWWKFLNKPLQDYSYEGVYIAVFRTYLEGNNNLWYKKLDLLEYVIRVSIERAVKNNDGRLLSIFSKFVNLLNSEFERLDFGYRIIDNMVTDITSDEEIKCLEQAIAESKDNVREHLEKALEHYSHKPDPDIRNSIKEAITAVETVCREYTGLTGDNGTLGKALNKLEEKGIILHPALKRGFDQLYTYTNSAETGIRHALMDPDGKYVPSKDEAYLMLVQCSTFINYLRMKIVK